MTRGGERLCVAAAVLYLLGVSLTWYRVAPEGAGLLQLATESRSYRGWAVGYLWAWTPAVLSALVAAISLWRSQGRALPDLGLPWHQIVASLTGMAALTTGLRFVLSWSPPRFNLAAAGYATTRREGLYVTVVAAGLLVAGAVQQVRAAGSQAPHDS